MIESEVPDEFHVGNLTIVVKACNIGKVKPRKRYIEIKDFGTNLPDAFHWALSRCGPGIRVIVRAAWNKPYNHDAALLRNRHGISATEAWISEDANPWQYYFEYGWTDIDWSDYGDEYYYHTSGTNLDEDVAKLLEFG